MPTERKALFDKCPKCGYEKPVETCFRRPQAKCPKVDEKFQACGEELKFRKWMEHDEPIISWNMKLNIILSTVYMQSVLFVVFYNGQLWEQDPSEDPINFFKPVFDLLHKRKVALCLQCAQARIARRASLKRTPPRGIITPLGRYL